MPRFVSAVYKHTSKQTPENGGLCVQIFSNIGCVYIVWNSFLKASVLQTGLSQSDYDLPLICWKSEGTRQARTILIIRNSENSLKGWSPWYQVTLITVVSQLLALSDSEYPNFIFHSAELQSWSNNAPSPADCSIGWLLSEHPGITARCHAVAPRALPCQCDKHERGLSLTILLCASLQPTPCLCSCTTRTWAISQLWLTLQKQIKLAVASPWKAA